MNIADVSSGAGMVAMSMANGNDLSSIEIFIDNGHGFTADGVAKFESGFFGENFKITVLNPESFGRIRSIRFDPCEMGVLSLSNLSIEVLDRNQKPVKAKIDFLGSNYVKRKKKYVFLDIDPQIKYNLKKPTECSEISIVFNMNRQLDWKTISVSGIKFIFAKILRKLKQMFATMRAKLGV